MACLLNFGKHLLNCRGLQFLESLGLDLADALARDGEVLSDLRAHPPRLVLWPASVEARTQWASQLLPGWERREPFAAGLPTADVMIGVDTIPSPLRYFIISQHVLRHFRPADRPGYLLRAEPEFSGFAVIPPDLNGPLRCGRLPLTWAASRWHPTSRPASPSRRSRPAGF